MPQEQPGASNVMPLDVVSNQIQHLWQDLGSAGDTITDLRNQAEVFKSEIRLLREANLRSAAENEHLRGTLKEHLVATTFLEELLAQWLHEHPESCGCLLCADTRAVVAVKG